MCAAQYDYIIAGAGLSGLSLAWRMIKNPPFANKNILVVDQSFDPANDRTWSFWHSGPPPFRNLVYKSWNQVEVIFNDQSIIQPIRDYTYHSIHSGAFQRTVLNELQDAPNVDLLEASIKRLQGNKERALLETTHESFKSVYIFQSCFPPPALQHDHPYFPLIQHFLGWEVQTNRDVFDPSTITLMDFDPNFSGGIAFIYILPQSKQKALVEYTIFSDHVKQQEFYEEKLSIYLHNKFNLPPLDYKVNRTEYGEIPMQDHRYAPFYAPRIVNMGTVGGLTKPSTGYTFSRIQKDVDKTIDSLITDGTPALPYRSPLRYRAYDLWLLQILYDDPQQATQIFQQLFGNNSMDEVFRFLSEENGLLQDFKTMSRVSYLPFFRAMWKTRKRLLKI